MWEPNRLDPVLVFYFSFPDLAFDDFGHTDLTSLLRGTDKQKLTCKFSLSPV